MATPILTQTRLKELMHYDANTGVFTWRVARPAGVKAGDVAGATDAQGYRILCADKRYYKAHRVAWLYMTGAWPVPSIDHIDRNPSNNCFSNLRAATTAQNGMNRRLDARNTSGVTGVTWCKTSQKWRADIGENGKIVRLGRFDTLANAIVARKTAEERHSASAYIHR